MPMQCAPDPGQECTSCSLRILKLKTCTRSHSWGWGHILIQMEQPNGSHGCLLPLFIAHRETGLHREDIWSPTYLVGSLQLVQLSPSTSPWKFARCARYQAFRV